MSILEEYVPMNPGQLEAELRRLIQEYNRLENTYLLVYAGASVKALPEALLMLNVEDYRFICDILRDVKSKTLDFYVETPGGDGIAAEEIVTYVHDRFESVRFVVSGDAKSAGTIMVLSGDEILMSSTGSLGPIDAQKRVGRGQMSAFDYLQWMKEKSKEAKKSGVLNPVDATIIAQITPGELKGIHYALDFAQVLVREWLPKYKFKNWATHSTTGKPVTDKEKEKRAKEIAQALTSSEKWKVHGRPIKVKDLADIGLKVQIAEEKPELADILYRIQMVVGLLLSSTPAYKVFVTADNKLFKRAEERADKKNEPNVAHAKVDCKKCGDSIGVYGKLVDDPKIDEEAKKRGLIPWPSDDKVHCACGEIHDIRAVREQIEKQLGKQIIK